MNSCKSIITLLFLLCLALLLSIYKTWHFGFDWWDQQRLYQLSIISTVSLLSLKTPFAPLPKPTYILIILFLLAGIVSASLATYPWYAFKEWGLYLGLLLLTLLLTRQLKEDKYQYFFLFSLAFIAFLNAYQFLVYYVMAFATGIYILDADLLFNGFSNPRFLNQFQGLLIPLIGFLSIYCWQTKKPYNRTVSVIIFITLAVQWCIALTLGGRSLWMGLGLAHFMLLLFFRHFWRLAAIQVAAIFIGGVLFYVLFYLIPDTLNLSSEIRTSLRTTSSGRIELWQKALAVYWQSPWLGVGPMHLAAEWHLRLASPHQTLLQLLAEWGPFPLLIAVYLTVTGMLKALLFVRSKQAKPLDAALWLAIGTALVMAQFEGVFNAPYTQMWLAIIIAIALARWLPKTARAGINNYQLYTWRALAIVCFIITAAVLITEVPTLPQDSEAHMEKHGTGWVPRYWLQGWIPMDP